MRLREQKTVLTTWHWRGFSHCYRKTGFKCKKGHCFVSELRLNLFLEVQVSGSVCATPWMVCECSGSGFSLNTQPFSWSQGFPTQMAAAQGGRLAWQSLLEHSWSCIFASFQVSAQEAFANTSITCTDVCFSAQLLGVSLTSL